MKFDTLQLLHKIYSSYVRPLSDFRLAHHWVTVSTGGWSPVLKVVRLPDLPQDLQDQAQQDDGGATNSVLWFLGQHPVCFIYPMSFMGVPLGYALREVSSRNFSVYPVNGTSCYTAARALSELGGFRYYKPVVIVEGYADAEAVSQVYPYVMAMMSCSIKRVLRPLLPLLTSQVYIMFDNDKRGKDGQERGLSVMREYMKADGISMPSEYKDPAEWFVQDEAGFRKRLSSVFGG